MEAIPTFPTNSVNEPVLSPKDNSIEIDTYLTMSVFSINKTINFVFNISQVLLLELNFFPDSEFKALMRAIKLTF